ncbi:fibrinogen C domain-containing protein 1 [Elysia marginata]|uniref:Fibrinogen C domain-containing protein 1 n=1 Tax=Elysia marginata TaxID=1093978 RepID=A0AAV4HDK9_9GAST|nr:fibrinogen C domain-containing protein 1 [Elysia marginata]
MAIAKMKLALTIAALLNLVAYSLGLSLSLDFKEKSSCIGGIAARCVLTCEESDVTSGSDQDLNSTSSSDSSITSMRIFTTSVEDSHTGNRHLLASLTLHQPHISNVSDIMKIEGYLRDNSSTLRLEVFNETDCTSDFTCEVVSEDVSGRETKSSSRLQQMKPRKEDHVTDRVASSPDFSSLVLMLAQQLALLENRLEDKIRSVEDKIETRVVDKLHQLEVELSASNTVVKVETESKACSENVLVKQEEILNNSNSMVEKVESSLATLASVERQLSRLQNFSNTECCRGSEYSTDETHEVIGDILSCLNVPINHNVSMKNMLLDELKQLNHSLCNISRPTAIPSTTHDDITETKTTMKDTTSSDTELLTSGAGTNTTVTDTTTAVTNTTTPVTDIATLVTDTTTAVTDTSTAVTNTTSPVTDTATPVTDTTTLVTDTTTPVTDTTILVTDTTTPSSEFQAPSRCRKGLKSFIAEPGFPYHVVQPNEHSDLHVPYLCDQTTDGGGWIIIQRRTNGQEDFYRDWNTYKTGFGSLDGDFWIGNENLHFLTSNGTYELRIEFIYRNESAFAHYDKFSVASEADGYALTVRQYSGTAGDALAYHDGAAFSTFDKNNSKDPRNCAYIYVGAWWYKQCHSSNLNGVWGAVGSRGLIWSTLSGSRSLSFSEMKIRSVDEPERMS